MLVVVDTVKLFIILSRVPAGGLYQSHGYIDKVRPLRLPHSSWWSVGDIQWWEGGCVRTSAQGSCIHLSLPEILVSLVFRHASHSAGIWYINAQCNIAQSVLCWILIFAVSVLFAMFCILVVSMLISIFVLVFLRQFCCVVLSFWPIIWVCFWKCLFDSFSVTSDCFWRCIMPGAYNGHTVCWFIVCSNAHTGRCMK